MDVEDNKDKNLPAPDVDKAYQEARRNFLKQSSLLTALAFTPPAAFKSEGLDEKLAERFEKVKLSLLINGERRSLLIEPRQSLLDVLRHELDLIGTKKGCDYGQCGACTVHVNGEAVLSCLSLAVMQEGKTITTIEGLAPGDELHPMQAAFIVHDGLQCGYCTPGQIMNGIACIRQGKANSPHEIREYMSGNLCRCGAYPNIVKAIEDVKAGGHKL